MKLYHFPPSPNSRRVIAVLHHLNLACELQVIDLSKREHLTPEFVRLNPNHMIPTLVDEDFALWESNAIMQYLCSKVASTSLYSTDPRVQADINRWLFWQVANLGSACTVLGFERVVKPLLNLGEPDAQEIAKAEPRFHRFAKVLDKHLQERDWLVGDCLTLADFSVGSLFGLAKPAQYPMESYTAIQRWYAAIEQLPAWQSSNL